MIRNVYPVLSAEMVACLKKIYGIKIYTVNEYAHHIDRDKIRVYQLHREQKATLFNIETRNSSLFVIDLDRERFNRFQKEAKTKIVRSELDDTN